MLDETGSKTVHNNKEGDRYRKSNKLSEVKIFEDINKNPQSFLERSPVKKEVFLSRKLKDYAYKYYNLFPPRGIAITN